MKKVLAILAAVLMLTSALIGCGGGNSAAGTYKLKSMSANGMEFTRESYQALLDLAAAATGTKLSVDDVMKLELTNDGKFKISIYQEEDKEGTYKIEGEKITLSAPDGEAGDAIEGTLKNGELTISMDGTTVVFAK